MTFVTSNTSGVCPHTETVTEVMPQTSRHYARLRCKACGLFLRFLPRPGNVQKWASNGYRLAKLQMLPGLQHREHEFLQGLAKQSASSGNYKFTPQQQQVFDRLCQAYLQKGKPAR